MYPPHKQSTVKKITRSNSGSLLYLCDYPMLSVKIWPSGTNPYLLHRTLNCVVTSAGFEPAASWFEARRSIQMSYEVKLSGLAGINYN
jgi:hypothetical protein